MRTPRAFACAIVLAFANTAVQANLGSDATLPMSAAVPFTTDSLIAQLRARLTPLGHTRASLRAALGRPLRVRTVAAEGPQGELDTLFTLRYPGLEIILRKSGSNEFFSNVRALDTTFVLPAPLVLFSTTEADVRRLVGPTDRHLFADTTVLSRANDEYQPVVQFYCVRGILVRVRWVYELG